MERKYKIDDKVSYKGLNAVVDYLTQNVDGLPMVGLTALYDDEMTCTALESECDDYAPDLDESDGIFEAKAASQRIQNLG